MTLLQELASLGIVPVLWMEGDEAMSMMQTATLAV